jgi:hypothetical protein
VTVKPKNQCLRQGGITPEAAKVRYLRKILSDDFTYEIPKSMALYLLDGPDKAERLAAASRQRPLISYSGISLIWRESRKT